MTEGVVPTERTPQASEGLPDAPSAVLPSAVPAALVATDVAPTGDDAVDEALSSLTGLGEQPLRAHVAVFDAVHGALQDRLADAEA